MTREDRDQEIADYVAYLDQLYASTFALIKRDSVTVHVLGFSQGTATAARWLKQGKVQADRLIIWGSPLPPDIDRDVSRFQAVPVILVAGNEDGYMTPKIISMEEARLERLKVPFRTIRFEGRHVLDPDVLRRLAGETGEEARAKRKK
jgi:predicted esterase